MYEQAMTQIGGDHYSSMEIEPITYINSNNLNFTEGSVVKYVSRWRSKGGVEDLKKAKHLLEIYIAYQEANSVDIAG